MKAAVIYNPSAGKGRASAVASAIVQGLVSRGFEVGRSHPTRSPKDAMEIARRLTPTVGIIVAVGGDGTVNEVVTGMADGPLPRARLAIVPAGTVNVLARELKLPFRPEHACDVIAAGKTAFLDLGRANERSFLLMMGAGVDALTVRNVNPRSKRWFTELAFVYAGLRHGFATSPPAFLVQADGRTYRATFFVAGNSRYYTGHLSMTPLADLTDGLLDLMIFTGTTRRSLAVFWFEIPGGRHLRNPNVTYIQAKRADLTPIDDRGTVWFQTDGEPAGRLPATVEIDSHPLAIFVP